MLIVTPLFAAVFAVIYLGLSINVIRFRLSGQISIGDGGDKRLAHAVRAHANFIEYVPLMLILMWFIETLTFSSATVFWIGSILLVARLLHILGMLFPVKLMTLRPLGMVGTFAAMLKAVWVLVQYYLPVSI